MSVDVVVSVYRDSVDWLRPLQDAEARLVLLDKWDRKERRETRYATLHAARAVHLPNVGMCDHSYLHHICECYDGLADWTVFTPDAPHDHLHGASMEDALRPGESLRVPRVWRGRDWGPDGRLTWAVWTEHRDRFGVSWAQRYREKITPAALSFVEWMQRFVGFDVNGPDWPGYAPGGIYAVPKRAIAYLPRVFYERLREQLSHSDQPEEGHYMERAWVVIFTGLAKYREAECDRG